MVNFGGLATVGKDAASGKKDLVQPCVGHHLLSSHSNLALYGLGTMEFPPMDGVLP